MKIVAGVLPIQVLLFGIFAFCVQIFSICGLLNLWMQNPWIWKADCICFLFHFGFCSPFLSFLPFFLDYLNIFSVLF